MTVDIIIGVIVFLTVFVVLAWLYAFNKILSVFREMMRNL
jgi:hypothetical protein